MRQPIYELENEIEALLERLDQSRDGAEECQIWNNLYEWWIREEEQLYENTDASGQVIEYPELHNSEFLKSVAEKFADQYPDGKWKFTCDPDKSRFVVPFWQAACNGEWETVKRYLENAPWLINVTGTKRIGNTVWHNLPLFHLAAGWCSHVDILEYLVSLGANVNAKMDYGWTPLHMATAEKNSLDVLKYLVSQGADVNAKNNHNMTPFDIAAESNSLDALQYLNFFSPDTNANRLLFIAAAQNSPDTLEYLVSLGADALATTDDGWTPLHWAAMNNSVEGLKYLVSLGADVNAMTTDGITPLHIAVECGNDTAMEQLILRGADVNAKDSEGKTPLHKVFDWFFNRDAIKSLIFHGAEVNAKDNDGKTPLDVLISSWYYDYDVVEEAKAEYIRYFISTVLEKYYDHKTLLD